MAEWEKSGVKEQRECKKEEEDKFTEPVWMGSETGLNEPAENRQVKWTEEIREDIYSIQVKREREDEMEDKAPVHCCMHGRNAVGSSASGSIGWV